MTASVTDAVQAVRRADSRGPMLRQGAYNSLALGCQLVGSFVMLGMAFRQVPATQVGTYSVLAVTVGLVQVLDPSVGYAMTRLLSGPTDGRRDFDRLRGGMSFVALALGGIAVALALAGAAGAGTARTMLVVSAALLATAAVSVSTAGLPAAAAARLDYASILLASAATATVGVVATVLLLPHVGVAGLALAQLLGVLVGRLTLFLSQRGSDPAAAARPSRSALPAVVRSSGALYLSSLAAQALTVCDLWTVGLLRGGAASASYRAGSLVPSQTASLFYRAYDVVYPRLPGLALAERQLRAVRLVTRISSGLAGVLFTFLLVERQFFVHLLVGSDDVLAQRVLAVFCLIWMVNVPIHGVSLLLIARNRPNVLAPLALGEAALNAVVSVVLVLTWGPLGAAWGTLLTMGVSNLLVMPMVAERRVPGCARVVLSGTASVLAGVGALLVLSWPASFAADGAARLVANAAAALVAAVAVSVALGGHQDIWPRRRNA